MGFARLFCILQKTFTAVSCMCVFPCDCISNMHLIRVDKVISLTFLANVIPEKNFPHFWLTQEQNFCVHAVCQNFCSHANI